MSRYRWRGNRTLEITVRDGERFADCTRLDADSVRQAFDEQIRWVAPHPPGTHFNINRRTRAEVATAARCGCTSRRSTVSRWASYEPHT
jgi:hypothetical protein